MTVYELIQELVKCPPDAEVFVHKDSKNELQDVLCVLNGSEAYRPHALLEISE